MRATYWEPKPIDYDEETQSSAKELAYNLITLGKAEVGDIESTIGDVLEDVEQKDEFGDQLIAIAQTGCPKQMLEAAKKIKEMMWQQAKTEAESMQIAACQ